MAIAAGLVAFALACGVELTVVGAVAGIRPGLGQSDAGDRWAEWAGPVTGPSGSAGPSPSAPPAGPGATAPPVPKEETRTVTETATVPFAVRTVRDSSLAEGEHVVQTRGVVGVKTLTYEVTLTDGVPTERRLIRSVVTRKPVNQVTIVGTKGESDCDPNYSGCVPVADDVDCAGRDENGPAYVTGPVTVLGTDVHRLDSDGNGVGCDE